MDNGPGVWLVVLCSSIVALLYNVVHALLIKKTSAVTVTVLGEVKVIGLLILSAIILGKHILCLLGQQATSANTIVILTGIALNKGPIKCFCTTQHHVPMTLTVTVVPSLYSNYGNVGCR